MEISAAPWAHVAWEGLYFYFTLNTKDNSKHTSNTLKTEPETIYSPSSNK